MEAPVAAALGKVDAFNLFDPYWMDPEYDIYYRMLNAGIRLPASTGTDWFVCSANRVYAYTGGPFDYGDWLAALRAGRTFITNGPALWLEVDGQGPGAELSTSVGAKLQAKVRWESHYPIESAELVVNGRVVKSQSLPGDGSRAGVFEADIEVTGDGWVAARLGSSTRDSFAQPLFAHTSPVYVSAGAPSPERALAATALAESIGKSIQWITQRGRFYTDTQRREVADLFRQGRDAYLAIAGGAR